MIVQKGTRRMSIPVRKNARYAANRRSREWAWKGRGLVSNLLRGPLSFLVAFILPCLSLLIRKSLPVDFGQRPMLIIFMPALIFIGMANGPLQELLATLLTASLTAYFLVPPVGSIAMSEVYDVFQWGMLVASGLLLSALAAMLRSARLHVEEELDRSATAERLLLETSERMRLIFEQSSIGIALSAPDGRWLMANRKFCEMVGYGLEELVAMSIADITHPPDLAEDLRFRARCMSREIERYTLEKRYIRKDGGLIRVRLTSAIIWKPDGSPDFFFAIAEDIQNAWEAKAALKESEERLMLFIEYSPAAIAMLDRDMCYLAVSKRWMQDYGLGNRDIIGLSHYEVFPEIPPGWREAHLLGLEGRMQRNEEDRFVRADGKVQWLRWEILPWHRAVD
jgi:PAS domain S-box-containing protein